MSKFGHVDTAVGPEARRRKGHQVPRDTERADRILDAAGELLLRHGYRKVTIDDVARQAHVGKGTVYLHWKTKVALFQSLLVRESIALVEDLRGGLRADPNEVRPHRLLRLAYLTTFRRPLALALVTGDVEMLGELRRRSSGDQADDEWMQAINERFFSVLAESGLLRTDVPDLAYTLNAAALGFFLADDYKPALSGIDREQKADALAHTIRHAFEPPGAPDAAAVHAVADRVDALLTELITRYRELFTALDAANAPVKPTDH
ncbi:TetR/AcrR family transcriptional regulator [Saccharopolyspora sp. NFXS83]|uniref:TetR/AcrR family transcriptional regulator n=1 Tax=Saccharopolyspora sp. NFXS83 TaxID=2993560 RepID=UPI00224AAEF8|nr:TetR/AcrR family transcriptional regulator [Saccharopolyspora sp. NFXS83]MCX2732535.1 TetR/AcrR family transcriptional regulator [Saccharopolyspora sp. NFXS83]